MCRTLLCKRLWQTSKPSVRRFHSTPCRRADTTSPDLTESIGSHSIAFHDLFQLVHDHTTLPWLLSIPIGTVLIRSLLTPFRFYLAFRRRDQRLAISRLEFASTVIEKQNASRIAAGIDTANGSDAWKKSEWIKWRNEIDKLYPGARPSILVSPMTNFDAGNWIATAMVAININTIYSLIQRNPEVIELVGLEAWGVYMSGFFGLLAISNASYYHPDLDSGPNPQSRTIHQLQEMLSSLGEKSISGFYMPLAGAIILSFMPGPVILSVLSSTAYTTVERQVVDFLTRVPRPVNRSPRAAVQTTQAGEKMGSDKT